jgi:hypothetical protein
MQITRFLFLFPGLMLAFVVAAPNADAKAPNRGESALVRVFDADDDNARGRIQVRSHRHEERLEVKAFGIDSDDDTIAELYIEGDVFAEMILVGELRRGRDSDGEATFHYRARRKKGSGDLPLGAMTVSELAGRRIELWVDGVPLLEGWIPDISQEKSAKASVMLDATADAPAGARADLRIFSIPRQGSESFRLKVSHFPLMGDEVLHLYLEDPLAMGTLLDQGELIDDDRDESAHHFRIRTRKGDPMPFGLEGVAQMEGLMMEIRNDLGDVVYFMGLVPALD